MSEPLNQLSMLPVGTQAPDFSLPSSSLKGKPDELKRYRGHPVVLVFYQGDWTPVSTDQLIIYSHILHEFDKFDAKLLGIAVDSVWSHMAFAKERNLRIPLLSDFEPKGTVSKTYNAYHPTEGRSIGALFVIDPKGVIAWNHAAPHDINPGADIILKALAQLK